MSSFSTSDLCSEHIKASLSLGFSLFSRLVDLGLFCKLEKKKLNHHAVVKSCQTELYCTISQFSIYRQGVIDYVTQPRVKMLALTIMVVL